MSKYKPYRLSYYEDDVVVYSSKGKYPKIPKKYEYCKIGKNTYKSFISPKTAEIALNVKRYGSNDDFTIFKCDKCGLYHIMLTERKKKLDMKNMDVTNEKKVNKLFGSIKKAFKWDDGEFTAERAWLESTYGVGSNLSTEERIENKQKDIKNIINSKFRCFNGNCENRFSYSSYRCVIDIEEDLAAYKDIILQPFIENGFKVINLSEKIDEMGDENVYLISWKNIFKK